MLNYFIILYYIILYYIILYYIILYYIIIYYIILYHIILYYITLFYIILNYITLLYYFMILYFYIILPVLRVSKRGSQNYAIQYLLKAPLCCMPGGKIHIWVLQDARKCLPRNLFKECCFCPAKTFCSAKK